MAASWRCMCHTHTPLAAGSQLETERTNAINHEATAERLKGQIAALQEQKLKEQLQHSEDIDRLIAQLKDAQAKVAEVSEQRQKAEEKFLTARKCGVALVGGLGVDSLASAAARQVKLGRPRLQALLEQPATTRMS